MVLSQQKRTTWTRNADGTRVIMRWFDAEQGDRLLLVNLAVETDLNPAPEPLLAPPLAEVWELSVEQEVRYGARVVNPLSDSGWRLPPRPPHSSKLGQGGPAVNMNHRIYRSVGSNPDPLTSRA